MKPIITCWRNDDENIEIEMEGNLNDIGGSFENLLAGCKNEYENMKGLEKVGWAIMLLSMANDLNEFAEKVQRDGVTVYDDVSPEVLARLQKIMNVNRAYQN